MPYSNSLSCLCVCSLLLWSGCADDGTATGDSVCADEESCDSGSGETHPGDGDGDEGDGDGDSGDGDGDSGDGDGDGDGDSGDGDGDGDSGDGDGDGDGDSGDGDGDPDNVSYTAVAQPGGLDRVFVERHDGDTNTCTRIVLVTPTLDFSVMGLAVLGNMGAC